MGTKHCGKRRKYWSPAFFLCIPVQPFQTFYEQMKIQNFRLAQIDCIIHADNKLTHYQTIPCFNYPGKKAFENFRKKGENAGYKHFLLFPQFFLSYCTWEIFDIRLNQRSCTKYKIFLPKFFT